MEFVVFYVYSLYLNDSINKNIPLKMREKAVNVQRKPKSMCSELSALAPEAKANSDIMDTSNLIAIGIR